jgi:hypothetical protein
MKSKFRYIIFAALSVGILSCDDDTDLPVYTPLDYAQDFNEGADNSILVTEGWRNYAEAGTALWKIQEYSNNGYAEFTSYQSGEASNIAWLISPAIALEENNDKTLRFYVSQSFVSSTANKLEVLVSTNYDGTNVAGATWTAVNANLPGTDAVYFEFQDSGEIDLSGFSGNAYVAFKVTGSGTNTSLDGSYQIDNFRIYTK